MGLDKITDGLQDTLEFKIKLLTDTEKKALPQKIPLNETSAISDKGVNIVDLAAKINIAAGGSTAAPSIVTSPESVAVIVDLSKYTWTQEQINKLCGVRLMMNEKGEAVPLKYGGSYDAVSKTFTFYTGGFDYCTLMSCPSLTKIDLFINNNVTKLNDKYKLIDVPPTIVNNRTMVPLRYIGEALGAQFDWNEKTQTVTFKTSQKEVKMVIGQRTPELDTPPVIMGGRTLVPVRYISEAFGGQVMWFPSSQKIMVVK